MRFVFRRRPKAPATWSTRLSAPILRWSPATHRARWRRPCCMMNNEQLQQQINAAPDSGTMLAAAAGEAGRRCHRLPSSCSSRCSRAMPRRRRCESRCARASIGTRSTAFEDLLWSLVNSAEFTTRQVSPGMPRLSAHSRRRRHARGRRQPARLLAHSWPRWPARAARCRSAGKIC